MDKQLADKIVTAYLKKIYGFSVDKMQNIDEAEELASDILLSVYESLLKSPGIVNMDGFIWRVSQNVFAKRMRGKYKAVSVDGIGLLPDDSNDVLEELAKSESFGQLRLELTYLSEIRRKAAVLYYFNDKKVKEIAKLLSIPENTVKWHLSQSRKELRSGMDTIRTTGKLGLEPISFYNMGHSGHAGEKGDTGYFLANALTQNIAYAAYHQPRSINEIAEELGVNPIFVKDEVAVLEEYGFMDKLQNGKYRTNILIDEPNEQRSKLSSSLQNEYTKLLCEKYIAQAIEEIKDIPDFITVPDNDVNLLRWAAVMFIVKNILPHQDDNDKFYVKRPDGGEYIAFATVKTQYVKDNEKDGFNSPYWICGEMWRGQYAENGWKSWQVNCYFTDRNGGWQENLEGDYDKICMFLDGELPETTASVEAYKRLIDKGYLLKKDGEYKVNVIVVSDEGKWYDFIPKVPEQAKEITKEYAEKNLPIELDGQPEHMHELIEDQNRNAVYNLYTHILFELLNTGVLKEPTDEQKKGLLTILFKAAQDKNK